VKFGMTKNDEPITIVRGCTLFNMSLSRDYDEMDVLDVFE
jgi:hypothetical protein